MKRTAAWLLVVCASIFLAGCDSKPPVTSVAKPAVPPAAGPAGGGKKVALVMKTLTNPFFVEMEKGARRAEKEFGIELLVRTAAQETSIDQQIGIVDGLIDEKVDAIVIAPGDSQRLVPVLKKAASAGIRLVNIDNRLDASALQQAGLARVPFISVDNETAAYRSAKFIADQATVPTKAAILEGIASADNARQRKVGAERAFAENKRIRLVASEPANWRIDEGYAVTRKMFAAHPDIRLLFAANDMMALGALQYLKEANRPDVKVASYDALDEAVKEVTAGRLMVTVDQQAAEQGYQGVATALRLLAGKAVPDELLIDSRLVTAPARN